MEIDTNTTSAASIRSPLQAISNRKDSPQKHKKKRKRKRSPKADTKEPPHKKQKTLRTAEHLQHHTTQVLELTRLYDPARFSTDEADEQWTDDPTRKLRLTILKPPSSSSPSSASIWLRFSDLLSQGFKFSASTKPTASATKKHLLHDLDVYLRRRCVTQPLSAFVAKFNGRDFISEPALCILIDVLKEHDAAENVHVAHWVAFRFAYRARLFGRTFTSLTLSKPQDAADTQICTLCCLEDVASNFMSDNACDCQCDLHRGCSAMPGGAIPSEYEFCPLCVPMMPLKELRARRELTKDGDFEVETVVDYDSEDELYTVKWRGYPDQAACQTQLAGSFVEAVETFWATGEHGDTPKKAKLAIAELKADIDEDIDVEEEQTAEIREDVDEGQEDIDAEGELEEAKAEEAKAATPKPKRKKAATPKPKLYIPERLDEVMCAEDIVRGQRFTKATYERFKATKNKYRKWLQREVAKQSLVGRDVARFMRERGLEKLPKFHLRGVNDDWDCDLPRIRDIILDFLQRDWSAWTHDVSHPNVIIGVHRRHYRPENPAREYGADHGVHDSKAYGLFATARIRCSSSTRAVCGPSARRAANWTTSRRSSIRRRSSTSSGIWTPTARSCFGGNGPTISSSLIRADGITRACT